MPDITQDFPIAAAFELEMVSADADWLGTRPRFASTTWAGPRPTSTTASPVSAGRCTCGS